MNIKTVVRISVLLLLISCSREEQFPEKITLRVSPSMVKLTNNRDQVRLDNEFAATDAEPKKNNKNTNAVKHPEETADSMAEGHFHLSGSVSLGAEKSTDASVFILPERLLMAEQQYNNREEAFSMKSLQSEWDESLSGITGGSPDKNTLHAWIDATVLLLELTGDARYAEELQRLFDEGLISKTGRERIHSNARILPFIYTKNTDHIHLNIFTPSAISYEHTLDGNVKITQEEGDAGSGVRFIRFNMEKRRYIELFVRIPSNAEGAAVTVKKVKYHAPPGGYCLIAKKWKEGDVVEIVFPEKQVKK